MKLNTDKIEAPYIDAEYYTNIFKPNKNAMITGSFNNVESHIADFDAFRNRASELVDRLVNSKISDAGGIEYVSPTPQMFIRKATAAVVQFWFINGYTTSDLDNMLSLGSLNINQKKNGDTLRKIIGLDALLLIQKSGIWDGRVFTYDVSKQLKNLGVDVCDILLMSDALTIFQQKNDYDDNFHVDIDFSSELTGQAINRWIKIAETERENVSFEITGGSPSENARALIFINKDDFSSGISEAYIYSTKLVSADQKPNYYVKNDAGKLSIYVEVDDMTPANEAHLLISNIYADDKGEYKLMGSLTNSSDLTLINKSNILQNADIQNLEQRITDIEKQIADAQHLTQQIEDNKNNITTLQTSSLDHSNRITALEAQQVTNTANIQTNIQNIATNLASITDLKTSTLKSDGSVRVDDTFTPTAERDIVYYKIITDLEARLRTEFLSQTSGFKHDWKGLISFNEPSSAEQSNYNITAEDAIADISQLANIAEFDFTEGAIITIGITSNLRQQEELVRVQAPTNTKWNNYDISDDKNDYIHLIRVTTDHKVILRRIDHNNGNIEDIPDGYYNLNSLEQINGKIFTNNTNYLWTKKLFSLPGDQSPIDELNFQDIKMDDIKLGLYIKASASNNGNILPIFIPKDEFSSNNPEFSKRAINNDLVNFKVISNFDGTISVQNLVKLYIYEIYTMEEK